MKYYLEKQEDVLRELQSSRQGLSADEAALRLERQGPNKLVEGKHDGTLIRFIRQFYDPMIIMLLAAALISAVTSVYAHESFADVIIILSVILFNAVLGVIQESKAEKSIQALSDMMGSTAKVFRSGILTPVRSEELVVGDVIAFEAGDAIPADARLLEAASLQMEESALTGESTAVNKLIDMLNLTESGGDVLLGDRKNMIFSGSACVYGRGRAVVTATGMDTEMGRIAAALEQTKDVRTPLQAKLADLGKLLTKLVLGICAVVFAVTLLRQGSFGGSAILGAFMTAIALAVAAIPEGMPAVVTVLLSMGVTRMARRNAIVRQLPAVETLGCTQIICTDKTGTLTQNRMTVTESYGNDPELLARAMALCSDAELDGDRAVGEPTEAALVSYAAMLGYRKPELASTYVRIGEAPFDSARKLMSTVHRSEGSGIIQYTKGAPDVLLALCVNYVAEDGSVQTLTEEKRREILEANKSFADRALRVLAAAFRSYDAPPESYEPQILEQGLTFIGLYGMIDPCRPEALEAMRQCREAGIRAVMITGDHKDTAVAIGLELGIIQGADQAMTGAELEKLSDQELQERVEQIGVYARVQPEHKVRIVRAWQAAGKVVSMTGDGVNDASALKSADIGVGMGITGTDVSKSVSDIVLADDNFATIVHAVEEGRRIYDNIRKVIQFQMSTNTAEVLTVFICSMLGFNIFSAAQLLWINMITDCAPGLALGTEQAEKDVMKRRPRQRDEGFFADGMTVDIILQGLAITVMVLLSYFLGHFIENGVWFVGNSVDGSTMAFLTLSLAETFHSVNMRSRRGSLFTMGHRNPWLLGAVLLSVATTFLVIYQPFLASAFGFAAISSMEMLIGLGLALLVIPLVELAKLLRRSMHRA